MAKARDTLKPQVGKEASPRRCLARVLVVSSLLNWRLQAESLIDALLPHCRLIGNLWPCAQSQQMSAYPLYLNGSETDFPSRATLSELSKNFGSIRPSISSEPLIHVHGLIACEAFQIRVSRAFLLSEGHSAFPDQRMALFSSRFQCDGESSPVSSRSKRGLFCGDIGGLMAIICRFKKT